MDAFPLPVEGTETRVNAGASANEFMVTFSENTERVGKKENVCGWYHSHPGYGCWLSGIDVQTQMTYQAHQEPFLAVVIDPIRACAAGKSDGFAYYLWGVALRRSAAAASTSMSSSRTMTMSTSSFTLLRGD